MAQACFKETEAVLVRFVKGMYVERKRKNRRMKKKREDVIESYIRWTDVSEDDAGIKWK